MDNSHSLNIAKSTLLFLDGVTKDIRLIEVHARRHTPNENEQAALIQCALSYPVHILGWVYQALDEILCSGRYKLCAATREFILTLSDLGREHRKFHPEFKQEGAVKFSEEICRDFIENFTETYSKIPIAVKDPETINSQKFFDRTLEVVSRKIVEQAAIWN